VDFAMGPMQGRWVCRRCFASNDADATTCEQCGLERGADPGQPPAQGGDQPPHWVPPQAGDQQPQWTPPQAQPRPGWLQMVARFWWIGLIVVVAIGGWWFSARRDDSGQITNTGNLDVGDLRVGDCFDLQDPEASEVEEVEAKPCTAGHQYELYYSADMPSPAYPTEDEFNSFIESECIPSFNAYIGMDYNSSALYILPFTPTEDLWNSGDHSVQCVVYDQDDPKLTESLRNAAR
jgi:hypothetical protein